MKEDAQISRFMTADQWIKVDIVEVGPLWDRIRRHHPSYDAPQSAILAEGLMATLLLLGDQIFFSVYNSWSKVRATLKTSWQMRGPMVPSEVFVT